MAEDIKLMKGNEAIAHAAIRYGVDGTSAIRSLHSRRYWKPLWQRCRGKRPAW